MSLQGINLKFRAVGEEDLSLMIEWRNNPEINTFFYEREPLSMDMQKRWYAKYLENLNHDKIFIVEAINSPGDVVGMISVYHVDYRNRKAEWGRFIVDPKQQGHGYGKEMEQILYQYCFDYLNLNKVSCEVYAFNQKVVQAHEKNGCVIEGVLKNHIYRNGFYNDIVVMSIMRDDFIRLRNEGVYKFLP